MSKKNALDVTRREFIVHSAAAAAALAAGSCAGSEPLDAAKVFGSCMHDCPDTCSWVVTTENGRAVGLEGDPDHPYTRGRLCHKMNGFLTDVVYSPERVLYPLKRVGAKGEARFERVGWDEALDDVAKRLQAVTDEHGGEAVLPYNFAGTMGIVQGWSLDARFFARLGATRLEHTICGATAATGLSATLGTDTGILQEDLLDSRFIVMWGGNPVVTNEHGWPFVQEARAKGARLVVIDPHRSATAAEADWHLRPHPGTDTALALGLMHVIVREGLHDEDYLERYTIGFDRLRERLEEYPPEAVASITGVPTDDIVELAKAYATTRPVAIQMHIGLEKHRHGGMTYRTVACLPALVGAWREQGGGLLHGTSRIFADAIDYAGLAVGTESSTRSVSMSQIGRALTGAPDLALDPPIKAMIVYNSNPATIAPNQNLVVEGLKRDDLFTVVIEQFVTDTARYADYVFPATTQAEHLDMIVPYGMRYLALNTPAIEPLGEARPNTEVFRQLARRLGFDEEYLYHSDEELIRTALSTDHLAKHGVTFERLQEEGWKSLDLVEGPPFAGGLFPTPSGKCELYSESLEAQGLDPLPGYVAIQRSSEEAANHPLRFMSPKWSPHFVNSSHANQPRLEQAAGEPRLRIHPDDAAARGIGDGDPVRVFNARGMVTLAAKVTDEVQQSCVVMLHGWWASRIGGSSANALTHDDLADVGGGSAMHDTWVQVVSV